MTISHRPREEELYVKLDPLTSAAALLLIWRIISREDKKIKSIFLKNLSKRKNLKKSVKPTLNHYPGLVLLSLGKTSVMPKPIMMRNLTKAVSPLYDEHMLLKLSLLQSVRLPFKC